MSAYCYFNELTLCDSTERNRAFLHDFMELFRGLLAVTKQQCKKIVVDDVTGNRICEALQGDFSKELGNLYSALITKQFENLVDELSDEGAQDRANRPKYTIALSPTRIPECKALGCAFENASISVGFPVNAFWRKFNFRINKKDYDGNSEKHDAYCVTTIDHLRKPELLRWAERFGSDSSVFSKLQDVQCRVYELSHLIFCDGCWTALEMSKACYDWSNVWKMLKIMDGILWKLQFVNKSQNLQDDFNSLCSEFEYAPTEGGKTKEDVECRRVRTFTHKGKEIVMWQHLKYNGVPMIRVHLHFDSVERKIAIGYIGPHLPSSASKSGRV